MDFSLKHCNSAGMQFLKKLREDRGLSLYAMAKALGLIQQTYIYYETKANGVRLDVLIKVKEYFNLSWAELGEMIEKEVIFQSKKKKKEESSKKLDI